MKYRQTNEIESERLELENNLPMLKDFDWEVMRVMLEVIITKDGRIHSRNLDITTAQTLSKAEELILTKKEFLGSTEI